MTDVRKDIAMHLRADADTMHRYRKYVKVTFYDGEFGKATSTEEVINVRNYPQATAALRRIAHFFAHMHDEATPGKLLYPQSSTVKDCKVGAIVISISEMVEGEQVEVINYDIPIKDGFIPSYVRNRLSITPAPQS